MRRSILAMGLTVSLLAITACSAGGTGSSPTQGSGSPAIAIGALGVPTSFDVSGYAAGGFTQYFSAVFDSLLRQDGEGTPLPGLATSWEWDDTRTALTLNLVDDVRFTDGTAFDAEAATANLNRYRESTATDVALVAGIEAVEASDSNTVVIHIVEPDPSLLTSLALAPGYMSSPESWDNPDVATNPVGSGPYILDVDRTVIGSSYAYLPNADYWDDSVTQFESVTINAFDSSAALLSALRAHELDAANVLDLTSIDEIESAGFDLNVNRVAWQGLVLFDRLGEIQPALSDVRVRQAINYAIDREGLLNAVSQGYGTTTTQAFPAVASAYVEELDSFYPYDPDKARALLEDAGYGDGVTIQMPTSARMNSSLFVLIQELLSDVGVTVKLVNVGDNYLADILGKKYPVAWMQLGGGTTWFDASMWVAPDAPFNPFRTQTAEVDRLLQTIQSAGEEEADAAAKELSTYLVEEAWFAPFYLADNFYVTSPELSVVMPTDSAVPFMYQMTTS